MYKKQEPYSLSLRKSKWPFYLLTALLLFFLSFTGAKGLFTQSAKQTLTGGNKLQVNCFANDLQVTPINTTEVKVNCVNPKTASRASTNETQPTSQTTPNNPEPPLTNLSATIPASLPPSGSQGIWVSAAELAHLSQAKLARKRKNRAKHLKPGTIILVNSPDKKRGKTKQLKYPTTTIITIPSANGAKSSH